MQYLRCDVWNYLKVVAVKLIDKDASAATVSEKEIAAMLRVQNDYCVKLYEVSLS